MSIYWEERGLTAQTCILVSNLCKRGGGIWTNIMLFKEFLEVCYIGALKNIFMKYIPENEKEEFIFKSV